MSRAPVRGRRASVRRVSLKGPEASAGLTPAPPPPAGGDPAAARAVYEARLVDIGVPGSVAAEARFRARWAAATGGKTAGGGDQENAGAANDKSRDAGCTGDDDDDPGGGGGTLDVSGMNIGPNAARAVARVVRPGSLRVLVARDNPVGDAGAEALAALLSSQRASLASADLSSTGLAGRGAAVVLCAAAALPRLRLLALGSDTAHNRVVVGAEGAAELPGLLFSSASLERLYLAGTMARLPERLAAPPPARAPASALATLDLSGNGLTPDDARTLALAMAGHLHALRRLYLADNPALGDAGVAELSALAPGQLARLHLVDLSHCSVAAEGLALLRLVRCATLVLEGNPLERAAAGHLPPPPGSAEALAAVVRRRWAAETAGLPHAMEELNLNGCGAGDLVVGDLVRGLLVPGQHDGRDESRVVPALSRLRRLRLAHNDLTDAGARALAELLRACPDAELVDLSHNAIGDEGAVELARASRSGHLCLDDNRVTGAAAERLLELAREGSRGGGAALRWASARGCPDVPGTLAIALDAAGDATARAWRAREPARREARALLTHECRRRRHEVAASVGSSQQETERLEGEFDQAVRTHEEWMAAERGRTHALDQELARARGLRAAAERAATRDARHEAEDLAAEQLRREAALQRQVQTAARQKKAAAVRLARATRERAALADEEEESLRPARERLAEAEQEAEAGRRVLESELHAVRHFIHTLREVNERAAGAARSGRQSRRSTGGGRASRRVAPAVPAGVIPFRRLTREERRAQTAEDEERARKRRDAKKAGRLAMLEERARHADEAFGGAGV